MDTITIEINGMAPQLRVADLKRSVAFYETFLGFRVSFFYEDFYAGITNGIYELHLKLDNDNAGRGHRGPEDIDITFSVSGIGPFFESVSAARATITQPLREMPYGEEFYIADPDGNILAFLEIK